MSDRTKGFVQLVVITIFVLMTFIVSSLLGIKKDTGPERSRPPRELYVEVKLIAPGPSRLEFSTSGIVEARTNINIVPEVSGRILSVNKNFFGGGAFSAGDILFQVDPLDYELNVERLQAEVARAQTNHDLAKAEAGAALAEWQQLHPHKSAPELVARKPQLAEAQAALNAAKAQLETAKLSLRRSSYTYPFAGRVISSGIEKGQYVMAGQNYGQVYDLNSLEVRSSLEERQLEWLLAAKNPEVVITTDISGEKKQYHGVVKGEASYLDPQTRFGSVRFGLADKAEDLLPGTFVDVYIKGPMLRDVLTLPIEALQKEGNIWTVNKEGALKSLVPDIIYTGQHTLIVKGTGRPLQVVTSRISGAAEGMMVEVENWQELEKEKQSLFNQPERHTATGG